VWRASARAATSVCAGRPAWWWARQDAAGQDEPRRGDDRQRRGQPCEQRGGSDRRRDGREDRERASQQEVLDRVAVDRDPAEQLAAAQFGYAVARETERSGEEARPQRADEIQGGLMGGDPLAVAAERARPGERLYPGARE
jgi:hypothetical protein